MSSQFEVHCNRCGCTDVDVSLHVERSVAQRNTMVSVTFICKGCFYAEDMGECLKDEPVEVCEIPKKRRKLWPIRQNVSRLLFQGTNMTDSPESDREEQAKNVPRPCQMKSMSITIRTTSAAFMPNPSPELRRIVNIFPTLAQILYEMIEEAAPRIPMSSHSTLIIDKNGEHVGEVIIEPSGICLDQQLYR